MRTSLFAVASMLAAAGANAIPQARVDGRDSTTYVDYLGGFAIAGDKGSDGSLTPVTDFVPATLGLSGTHTFNGAYLFWTVTYTVSWDLDQSFAIEPLAHRVSGNGSLHLDQSSAVIGLNCTPCLATVSLTAYDTQALMFSLDAVTPYAFHSEATPGQWLNLELWNDLSQRWFPLWNAVLETEGKVFDRSGTLQAGRYRIANYPYSVRITNVPPALDQAWSFELTLPDAEVASVPEPAAGWLLGVGLVALATRRRPRAGPARPSRGSQASSRHRA